MSRPPRICPCGHLIPKDQLCACQIKANRSRKAAHDATRPTAAARGYDSRWRKAREVFLAQFPVCQRCGAKATLVDHKIPHKGNQQLFWDQHNWQPLCTGCHSGAKQREERRS